MSSQNSVSIPGPIQIPERLRHAASTLEESASGARLDVVTAQACWCDTTPALGEAV